MSAASSMNILGAFCGKRDVPALTRACLKEKYGFDRADVMVLFGASILAGGEVLAAAMREGIAGTYVIVGGAGHTTPVLREKMHAAFPEIRTEGRPEAEIFDEYIRLRCGLRADYLETESTNCGNNITNLLALLEKERIPVKSIILCQNAAMQRRMEAGLLLHRPDLTVINYAVYSARLEEGQEYPCASLSAGTGRPAVPAAGAGEVPFPAGGAATGIAGGPRFAEAIWGMWDVEHYAKLLLGEIARLRDDGNGYGPKGKGFIAHVDIPQEVEAAFEELSEFYAVREANPAFASDRLYMVDVRGLESEAVFRKWLSEMPDNRLEEIGRFRAEADRRRSLGAGIALRRALIDAGLDPAAEVLQEPGEKPRLKDGGLCFNLSHSGNLAVCAASGREVGVDVERYRSFTPAVIRTVFTAEEISWVWERAGGDEALQARLFTALWTAKESLMKYVGKGLALPPGRIRLSCGSPVPAFSCKETGVEGLEADRFRFVTRFLEEHVYTVCTEGEPFTGDMIWVEL